MAAAYPKEQHDRHTTAATCVTWFQGQGQGQGQGLEWVWGLVEDAM